MSTAQQIHCALDRVRDQASFLQDFLAETLHWPIAEHVDDPQDISYAWSQDDLRADGLDRQLVEAEVRQIRPFHDGQPWGVFLLQFQSPRHFEAAHGLSGATGTLRKVLRGLVPKRRREPGLPAWQREHLLFLCTHNYQQFRFAYFKAPLESQRAAPLATFGWNQGDTHIRTLCEHNLPPLAFPGDNGADGEKWVKQWASAFDVEAVTKRFFAEYREVFERVEKSVKGVPAGEKCRLYTQRLFNRLMFLYFIQRKGWLSFRGDKRYLRALFTASQASNEDFLNDRLYWTFFAGLNTPLESKAKHSQAELVERRGEVPFLNGGLFDLEDELDERGRVTIANNAFAAILDLFDKYNFTVTESTPLDVEVAVDPEMLGKVFEELVTGRHETGSYYTPRPIVSFMCREALKHYLCGIGFQSCGQGAQDWNPMPQADAVAAFVDDDDPSKLTDPEAVLAALKSVKVCDPACGSGAYLLGMMQELLRLRERLFVAHRLDAQRIYDRKLEIIQNNLYGVDIDLFAVNIAKLRLWLSLAVDYDGHKPPPLPNLDFKIECGDSLTAPDPQKIDDLYRQLLVKKADELAELKGKFLKTYGAEKKKLGERIKAEEKKLRESLHEQVDPGAVDWRVAFAEVFKGGGFDVVLANPPYGLVNKRQNQKFGHKISTEGIEQIRNSAEYAPILQGMINICSIFIRRSFSMLRRNGVFVEIFPLAFACDWSFGKLRNYLLHRHSIRRVEAFPERDDLRRRVFYSAKMSVCILVATRNVTEVRREFELRINAQPFVDLEAPIAKLHPNDLAKFDPNFSIPLVSRQDINTLRAIYSQCRRLQEIATCYTGEVDLTQDRKFIRSDSKHSRMYKGAIIGRYQVRDKMSQGEIEFLDAAAFCKAKGKKVTSSAWHHKRMRIVLQGITGINERIRLKMTLIPPGAFLANSANYILLNSGNDDEKEYLFLLAVLNSATVNHVFKCFSTNSNVNNYSVDNLPIPRPPPEDKSLLAGLAKRCFLRADEDCEDAEAQIEATVKRLFGLEE